MSRRLRTRELALRFPVTITISVVTLAFFAAEHWLGGATDPIVHVRLGSLSADRVAEDGEYWRLLMPLFLHFGWVHLLLNGLAFIQLGALVEALWGGRRLIAYYVVAGLGASLASAALNGGVVAGSVGASGAILGLAGLIVGTTWYGSEPVRTWLLDIVGRRLLYSVILTFALGFGLWLVLPIIDNWAHLGGFATGLLLAGATPDPTEEDVRRSSAGAAAATVACVGAMIWMGVAGGQDDREIALDIARTQAIRVSEQPDTFTSTLLLPEMLRYFDKAHEPDEGLDALRRAVDDIHEPTHTLSLMLALYAASESDEDVDRDLAIEIALDRWIELEPDDAQALNSLAWHLATRSNTELRDLDRALALSHRSLERIEDPETRSGRTQRAMMLDTLGEILFQLEELEQAQAAQQESVDLARQLEDESWSPLGTGLPLDEIEERLQKIEDAS